VRIIVGAGPGSASDVRARWLASNLTPVLGQAVIVENMSGAASLVATRAVARSAPDGYTLLLAHIGNMIVLPRISENAGYDPAADFAAVSRIATGYPVLTCSSQFPARSLQHLVKIAKEKPGALNWGNTGIGTPPWLMGELFRRTAGIEMTQVQYKGGGELLTDLMGGRIDCWMEGAAILMPHIKAGKIRALAVAAPERLAILPDVPTMSEAGLPTYVFGGWMGIVAPAATPRPVIAKLNAAIRQILSTPESRRYFEEAAGVPVQESPEEFAAFIRSETARWAPLVREANIQRD
jgi:tripartite-type tricarboxylate transporter receptor subunit TctC